MASNLPDSILEASNNAVKKILPDKSAARYLDAYKKFIEWRTEQKTESLDEEVFLAYFGEASAKYAPTSLWSMYSMIKKTIICNHNLNIAKYARLPQFLKKQMDGYESKKAEVFGTEEINNFLMTAPDSEYLAMKTVTVFGLCGACRGEEITHVLMEHVVDSGTDVIVHVPNSKMKKPKLFTIDRPFIDIVRRYMAIRPEHAATERFFILFRVGKCFSQPSGKNYIAQMPQKIAKYLGLPMPELYTGHSFRRTSTTILADSGETIEQIKRHGAWKSTRVAEGYIQESLGNKRKIASTLSKAIHLGQSGDDIDPEEDLGVENIKPGPDFYIAAKRSASESGNNIAGPSEKSTKNDDVDRSDSFTLSQSVAHSDETEQRRSRGFTLSQSITNSGESVQRRSIEVRDCQYFTINFC